MKITFKKVKSIIGKKQNGRESFSIRGGGGGVKERKRKKKQI